MAKPSATAAATTRAVSASDKEGAGTPPPAYESLNNKTTNDDDVSNASSDSPLNPNAPASEEEESSTSWFEKLTTRELLAISPNSDQRLPSNENGEKEEDETLKVEVVDPKKIGQGEFKRLYFNVVCFLLIDDTCDTHHSFSLSL